MSDQYKLTSVFCARPQQFAWLLGAGASATAGLPTAWDVIWDLKRRYYCQQENQKITRQDLQNQAVRARIQSYMLSKGFPEEGDPNEYTTYFQKIFMDDKERQRRYLTGVLSEENVTLSVGNRVLGALLTTGRTRVIFTTNFDSVVERAVAEVSGRSLSAYHLEGSASANRALMVTFGTIVSKIFEMTLQLRTKISQDHFSQLETGLALSLLGIAAAMKVS